jgi:4-hydroxy-2-oxoglutarate aldolase
VEVKIVPASFAGIYPPIATPFDQEERVDLAALRHNVAKWGESALAGLVVLGSNGEFPLVDDDERDPIISAVVEAARPGLKVIVGTGRESTRATIRMTKRAAELGAHSAIVINPSYYKGALTEAVLYEHYRIVAEESPLPILVYNVPPYTGINLSAGLMARLANLPNIVGVKDTSANLVQISETVKLTPPTFATLAGSVNFLLPALAVGAQGGILAVANLAPDECMAIQTAFNAGNIDLARSIHQKLLPVHSAVTTRFGAGGLKAAMEMRGYRGGYPRRPLPRLTAEQRDELAKILREAGLI